MIAPTSGLGRVLLVLTGVLLLALGYVFLVSGLVVPMPWLIVLLPVWLALVWAAVALRRRPGLAILVPLGGAAFWLLYVGGLGALLDWTA